jgi:hypothetical protein
LLLLSLLKVVAGFSKALYPGEDDLWRQSKRNPGKLLKTTMLELSRYLADRAPGAEEESDWTSHRMMAYISRWYCANTHHKRWGFETIESW